MNGLPLHPMLVHLPLALAGLAPLLALAALALHLARRGSRGFFLAVVALQLLLALGSVAALKSGEAEEEKVEHAVPEAAIEEHEEAAERFVAGAWIALGIALIPALWPDRRLLATGGALATLAATAVVLILGIQVGEAGAALVYRHGAASVYTGGVGTAPKGADQPGKYEDHEEEHEESEDD